MGDWTVTTPATCTAKGVQRRDCAACDYFETEEIAMTEHPYDEWFTTVYATCTVNGAEKRECTECDAYEERAILAPGEHTYEETVTPPTCTEEGYTTYTCTRVNETADGTAVCGNTYTGDKVDALGHDWSNWSVTTPSTCTTYGVETRTCTRNCGLEGNTETQALTTLADHKWTATDDKADATCTEDGYIKYTCDYEDCAVKEKTDIIAAKGHDYEETVIRRATCEKTGVASLLCSVCDNLASKTIPALGHNWVAIPEQAPTCTAPGMSSGMEECTNGCGQTRATEEGAGEIPALGHSFGEWTVTTPATCTTEGEQTRTCTLGCGEAGATETETIPALGHAWSDWTQTTAPGCETEGEETRTCNTCGEPETNPVTATGHSWTAGTPVPPTCTADGYTPYTCDNCGNTENRDTVAASGHSYGEWYSTKDATCEETGTSQHDCENCDDFETRTDDALGHDYVGTITKPKCEVDGFTTYVCNNDPSHTYTETDEGSALQHNYIAAVTAPKCTAGGYTTYTCEYCDGSYIADNTSALGHNPELIDTKAATCTVDGLKTFKCSRCGEISTETITATGHNETSVVTAPTCTTDGYTTYTCHCGATRVADTVAAKGHDYYTVVTAPTCTAKGFTTQYCNNCDFEEVVEGSETDVIPHNYAVEITELRVAPKCEIDGSKTMQCSECTSRKVVKLSATGHDYVGTYTEPTCTKDGYTTYICANDATHIKTGNDDGTAKGHTYGEWKVTTNPTCTDKGVETRECTLGCGEENAVQTRDIDATGHDYDAVVTAPTCTETGYTTYTCHCGDTYTADEVEATGHDYEAVVTAPTCTEAGYTTYTCHCGDTYTADEVGATGHDYDAVVTAPTCTKDGYTTYTCHCGDSYVADETPAEGHVYGEWTTTVRPTCEGEGEESRTCTLNCGETLETETRTVNPTGHDYVGTYTEPTCTENGYTTYVCNNDATHTKVETDKGSAKGHSYTTKPSGTVVQEQTCTQAELQTVMCDNCDTVNKNLTVKTKDNKGHTEVKDEAVEPTCTTTGLTAGAHCGECGHVIKAQTERTAKGHNYTSVVTPATCTADGYTTHTCTNVNGGTVCGDTYTDTAVPATGHNYVGVITTQPTCEDTGVETFTCSNCDDSYTEEVAAKGHSYVPVTTPAKCEQDAFTVYTCKNDAAHTYTVIAEGSAIGHKWNKGVITTPATCTTDGVRTLTCENDATHTTTEIVPATDHRWNAGIITTQPTCTEEGVKTFTCLNNSEHTKTEAVSARGHNYTSTVTDPTCEKDGYTTHTCTNVNGDTVCGDTYTDTLVPAKGHTYGDWTVTTAPTCTEEGEETRKCTRNCNETNAVETRPVDATGHNYDSVVTDPTCEDDGYTTHTCTNVNGGKVCGDTYTDTPVDALGHDWNEGEILEGDEPTCTEEGTRTFTCKNDESHTKTEPVKETGHSYEKNEASDEVAVEATCEDAAQHYVKCDACDEPHEELTVEVGEALGHDWDEGEILEGDEATCEEDGVKTFTCQRDDCDETMTEAVEKLGHDIVTHEAKIPTYSTVGWNEYETCNRCEYTTYEEIPMLEKPEINDYATFMENLLLLEQLAAGYVQEHPGTDPLNLVIKYIRTGVDRYNSGSWGIMAGYEDTAFAEYVQDMEDMINSMATSTEEMIVPTSLKNINNFTILNGDTVDFGHMFGTMDLTYHNNFSINHADVGGWAGDVVDLLCTADRHNVTGTLEEMIKVILDNYLAKNINESDSFGETDMLGDLDGFYVMHQLNGTEYESGDLYTLFESYFIASLNDEQRADYFLKNRLNGVTDRTDIRNAVYEAYTGNKVIGTLEGTREFVNTDISDLRKASCYAFADYLCKLAGDYVEITENDSYSVFSSEKITLAPGITQEIKMATTADNKQVKFYLATADINSQYVNVYANYNENDPTLGWAMSRVMDQANAAQAKYGDPASEYYIPNYSVTVATNGAGYNMTTGEPGGLLVMGGVEYHGPNSNGFFGILKNGKAVIGTTEEYNTIYKDQVREGIAGFGARLVVNGKIPSGISNSGRASRTAVGITKTGKVVLLVVDGRQEPESCGGSMKEIAQMMLEAGCVEAVNLDGGGSTTFVAKQPGDDELSLINKPSDGFQRSVSTSLMMVSTAPSDTEFDHALIESSSKYLTVNSSVQLTAVGISATGSAAEIPEGAQWKVSDTKWGTITEDGVFTGLRVGDVDVQLVADGKVIGSLTLHVVTPDALAFGRDKMDAVYGQTVDLPLVAYYNNKMVTINESDIVFTQSPENSGVIDGFTFTGTEGTGVKIATVTAALASDATVTDSIEIALYNQGEASFDFDKATAGDRQFAWDRQVSNSTTEDEITYKVIDIEHPMETTYTFAIDMTQIPIPEVLEELTYMLPGSDIEGASAWTFLMQLAERVSVLTEVRIKFNFDKNFDVDLSDLTIVNEYFQLKTQEFDSTTNELTLALNWIDQTRAIDPATANPLCIMSGVKLTPKANAAWDAKNSLTPVNSGDISYTIYLRANALYTFAQDPANQETFQLFPFVNPDDENEKGGYFGDTYKTFSDTYTLVNALKSGWVYEETGYAYYVDGEKLTGIQKIEGYYYDMGDDGINVGQTKYTGMFTDDGVNYYSKDGVLTGGWFTVDGTSYCFDENGKALDGTVIQDEIEKEFDNGKMIGGHTGFVTKSDGKTYHYVDGIQTFGWYYIGEDLYHFNVETGVMTTGTHVIPDPEAKAKGAYYDFAEDGRTLRGYFNGHGYYYWAGDPARDKFVKNGADSDPAAWYLTNANGHYATASESSQYVFTYDFGGVQYKAANIPHVDDDGVRRVYTINIKNGKLLEGQFIKDDTTGEWSYYLAGEPYTGGWFNAVGTIDKDHMWKEGYVTGNNTYYAFPDGTLATGIVEIDGEEYEFDEYGVLISEKPFAMYRMYNPNSGEHFYTGSTIERENLVNSGWHYEGVAFHSPHKGEPMYRLYNPNVGDHHYTGSTVERDNLISAGWVYEGVAFNSAPASEINHPQYRLYNPNAVSGAHHYTGSVEERDMLISAGWKYEGIGFYSVTGMD
ncbi:MAG: phosphodiester glycosidase family protein [Oscillospiraceae bacterium]|nr:phosphodiester glycosidase family protein [Oscillospiraceae bacterium]